MNLDEEGKFKEIRDCSCAFNGQATKDTTFVCLACLWARNTKLQKPSNGRAKRFGILKPKQMKHHLSSRFHQHRLLELRPTKYLSNKLFAAVCPLKDVHGQGLRLHEWDGLVQTKPGPRKAENLAEVGDGDMLCAECNIMIAVSSEEAHADHCHPPPNCLSPPPSLQAAKSDESEQSEESEEESESGASGQGEDSDTNHDAKQDSDDSDVESAEFKLSPPTKKRKVKTPIKPTPSMTPPRRHINPHPSKKVGGSKKHK